MRCHSQPADCSTKMNASDEQKRIKAITSSAGEWLNGDMALPTLDSLEKEFLARLAADASDETQQWALKFLDDYLDSGSTSVSSLELAIRSTHRPTELQALLFAAYARHFEKDHFEAVNQLRKLLDGATLLVMHLSCQPRLELAKSSAKTFSEADGARNLIVVGNGDSNDPRYHFDADQRILTVPAPDIYEGLSRKVAAAYKFIGFTTRNICLLKVDDDIGAVPTRFSAGHLVTLVQQHDYLGFVIDTRLTGMHRWWHLGKCSDEKLNETPYSFIGQASYARGPAYALSWKAISALAKASIYYCQQFAVEGGYEDLAVGKMLNAAGIHPINYDLEKHGFVYSTDRKTDAS